MKYFVTRAEKPLTKPATFNFSEEAISTVKEVVKGLKILGVNITQGEVINDLITAINVSKEKIYQVNGKSYSVEELCDVSFSTKVEGEVEDYVGRRKIKELVENFYKELQKIESELNQEVERQVIKELKDGYNEDVDAQNEYTFEEYKNQYMNDQKEYAFDFVLLEKDDEITEKIKLNLQKLKDDISTEIYDMSYQLLKKVSNKSANKVDMVVKSFYSSTNTTRLMEGLGDWRRYRESCSLNNEQVSYILMNKIGTNPRDYTFEEAYQEIERLDKEKKLKLDVSFFVKMANDIKKDMEKYSSRGVRMF